MKQLDLTDSKLKGKALLKEISDRVQETQLFILQPLPEEILLTTKQLKDLAEISGIHDSDYGGRFIRTDFNIMEIKEEVEYS